MSRYEDIVTRYIKENNFTGDQVIRYRDKLRELYNDTENHMFRQNGNVEPTEDEVLDVIEDFLF